MELYQRTQRRHNTFLSSRRWPRLIIKLLNLFWLKRGISTILGLDPSVNCVNIYSSDNAKLTLDAVISWLTNSQRIETRNRASGLVRSKRGRLGILHAVLCVNCCCRRRGVLMEPLQLSKQTQFACVSYTTMFHPGYCAARGRTHVAKPNATHSGHVVISSRFIHNDARSPQMNVDRHVIVSVCTHGRTNEVLYGSTH